MKIKDVVRGVEEKEAHNKACDCHNCYEVDGYNSLASAEVVVDREKMCFIARHIICDGTTDCENYPGCPEGNDSCVVWDTINDIATAIESGSIIRLKGEE